MSLNHVNERQLFYFVSYPHGCGGQNDAYVERFHRDLSDEVRLYSGVPDAVGFCDTSLRAGDLWSPALVDALCRCQVFLALCSRVYFNRPSCGKEWSIFERRLAEISTERHRATSSLIPLFWVPMEMPAVASPYQYRDRDLGPRYAEQGLRALIRLSRNSDQYKEFVTALALRVVDLADRVRVPPYGQRPDFDAVQPAFPPDAAASAVPRARGVMEGDPL